MNFNNDLIQITLEKIFGSPIDYNYSKEGKKAFFKYLNTLSLYPKDPFIGKKQHMGHIYL